MMKLTQINTQVISASITACPSVSQSAHTRQFSDWLMRIGTVWKHGSSRFIPGEEEEKEEDDSYGLWECSCRPYGAINKDSVNLHCTLMAHKQNLVASGEMKSAVGSKTQQIRPYRSVHTNINTLYIWAFLQPLVHPYVSESTLWSLSLIRLSNNWLLLFIAFHWDLVLHYFTNTFTQTITVWVKGCTPPLTQWQLRLAPAPMWPLTGKAV